MSSEKMTRFRTDRPKVIITDYDYGNIDIETSILEEIGAEVIGLQAKKEEDLFEFAPDCAAMINQYARIGADTINRMNNCEVIARYGIGVDIVDVKSATASGIVVTNVQDYCTEEVADHAISLWLTLSRKILDYNTATHEGIWTWKSGQPISRHRGKTMGIISFGKIGQSVAIRAMSFGVKIIVYDPYVSESLAQEFGVKLASKSELLTQSDYILMQAPMTEETHHFLSDPEFEIMKPGTILINTGRGPTIDNKALHRALTQGKLAGAGLDDPEEEPAKLASWQPKDNPLFGLQNVIVTPHAAYYSEESIKEARVTAATQVAKILTGQSPDFSVNFHQLSKKQSA